MLDLPDWPEWIVVCLFMLFRFAKIDHEEFVQFLLFGILYCLARLAFST
jgi:hypothetical protein